MQGLYQWQLARKDSVMIAAELAEREEFQKADADYFRTLLSGAIDNAEELEARGWKPEMVGHWEPLLPLNPFFAVVEAVRAPIMGSTGSLYVWVAAVGWTALGVIVSWVFFVRFRGRIAFWV